MEKYFKNTTAAMVIKKQLVILIGMVFCIILTACSSPEKDGIKAAKVVNNNQYDYEKKRHQIVNVQNKAYESYIKNFNSYSFKTRTDAREKLNEYLQPSRESFQKLQIDYQERQKKVNEYRDKLGSKYQTNREKGELFNHAYNNYKPKKSKTHFTLKEPKDYYSSIESLIHSVIPPKPDLERLKKDLNYESLDKELHLKYYTQQAINSLDNFNKIEILKTNYNDSGYQFQLRLKGAINQFDINATYLLQDYDDWTLSEKQEINIVSTGKHDNCIETVGVQNPFGMSGFYTLGFINHCDVAIVIGGEANVLMEGRKIQKKNFAIHLLPNEIKFLTTHVSSGAFFNGESSIREIHESVNSHVIHFIERPGL